MQIGIPYTFSANVIPWRARNRREMIFSSSRPLVVEIPEYTNEQAPLAFIVHTTTGYGDERVPGEVCIRFLDGKLWKPAKKSHSGVRPPVTVEGLPNDAKSHLNMPRDWRANTPAPILLRSEFREVDNGEDLMVQKIRDYIAEFILIDGVVHIETTEPRYYVQSYGGFGRQASVWISSTPNYEHRTGTPNLDRYFRADDFAGAKTLFDKLVARGHEGEEPVQNIEVLLPEAVRLDPRADERVELVQRVNASVADIDQNLARLANEMAELQRRRAELLEKL
jgi:hypothetical protein